MQVRVTALSTCIFSGTLKVQLLPEVTYNDHSYQSPLMNSTATYQVFLNNYSIRMIFFGFNKNIL